MFGGGQAMTLTRREQIRLLIAGIQTKTVGMGRYRLCRYRYDIGLAMCDRKIWIGYCVCCRLSWRI